MKTIGIIGGIGLESTILYYRRMIKKCKELDKSGNDPNIIINSINNSALLAYAFNKQYDELTEFMLAEINKLRYAGAEFGIIAANTPHIVYYKITGKTDFPLLSIVDETCKVIKQAGINKVALFGTKVTMQGGFYENTAKNYKIEIIVPQRSQQEYIHDKYITELLPGIIKSETKNDLLQIINDMRNEKNIEGLILGGTELSLILKHEDLPNLKIFDTTIIHAYAAVNYSLS